MNRPLRKVQQLEAQPNAESHKQTWHHQASDGDVEQHGGARKTAGGTRARQDTEITTVRALTTSANMIERFERSWDVRDAPGTARYRRTIWWENPTIGNVTPPILALE